MAGPQMLTPMLLLLASASGSTALAPTPNNASAFIQYLEFLHQYNRNYNATEFWNRYDIFRNNLGYIGNGQRNGYSVGVNKFADWSREEFRKTYLPVFPGLGPKPHGTTAPTRTPSQPQTWKPPAGIPTSVDWRSLGWVTPVKNQQQCGSCWAFSAIGTLEGQHANVTGNLVSLSEQDLVDCAYGYGCDGCNGGWPEAALRYAHHAGGVETEANYPYVGEDDPSCAYNKSKSAASLARTVNVTSNSMPALYSAIATIGPISVAIDAEDDFQFYKDGIFTSTSCSTQYLDHAVLAVGYSVSPLGQRYIIVKNSWGADWGMDGYIYMNADIPNMCGIASKASYPIV